MTFKVFKVIGNGTESIVHMIGILPVSGMYSNNVSISDSPFFQFKLHSIRVEVVLLPTIILVLTCTIMDSSRQSL